MADTLMLFNVVRTRICFPDLDHSNADSVAGHRNVSVCSGRVDSGLTHSVRS